MQRAAAGDAPVYGVNTGFGKLAGTRIDSADLAVQLNLIRSHSVGVGDALAAPVVRLILGLKAASLARGHSGVREAVVDAPSPFTTPASFLSSRRRDRSARRATSPLAHLTLA